MMPTDFGQGFFVGLAFGPVSGFCITLAALAMVRAAIGGEE